MIRCCSARKVFDVNVVGKDHQYAVHRGQRDAGLERGFPMNASSRWCSGAAGLRARSYGKRLVPSRMR